MAQVNSGTGFIKTNSTKLAGNPGGSSLSNTMLMGYTTGPAFYVNGDFYEIMIWSRVLTAGEESNIYNYFKAKYSLP